MPNEAQLMAAVRRYTQLGFDTFPLHPLKKYPFVLEWQLRDSYQLWRKAPGNSNIAIRMGGKRLLAVIDCDDKNQPGTFNNVIKVLSALGLQPGSYPLVQTASGIGRHIYILLKEKVPGNFDILSKELGAGEFRYGPGAYVVGEPSILEDGSVYTLLSGNFDQLPVLSASDLFPLLCGKPIDLAAIKKQKVKIPRSAWALLNGKIPPAKYRSRSEADQALITILVNAGHSYESVLYLFQKYPGAGKFSELCEKSPSRATEWLRQSFEEASIWTAQSESKHRRKATLLREWVASLPLKGRSGAYDQSVLLAHIEIMYRCGRETYCASIRDLADLANVTAQTAWRSTNRLIERGWIKVERPATYDYAAQYAITLPMEDTQTATPPHKVGGWECNSLDVISDDTFRGKVGLGRTAGLIWLILNREGPQTLEGIVEKTGFSKAAITRNLLQMSRITDPITQEHYPLVTKDGDHWVANAVDLGRAAGIIGSAGSRLRQQRRHKQERMEFTQLLRSQESEQQKDG